MTMPEYESRFNGARMRPQQRCRLALRFGWSLTAALIFAAFLALSCGGGRRTVPPSPVAPSPEITIQFLDETPVVQPGYLVGFKARAVGIADLSALEWSVSAGEIDSAEADRMWWWPPNMPDGEQCTITVSCGECSRSKTVILDTRLPPPWADELEIYFYYDFVQSGSIVSLVAEPDYWRNDPIRWEVSAGEIQYYENPSGSEYFWMTPDTPEDVEALVTFLWRGIPVTERQITVRGTDNAFFLAGEPGIVEVKSTGMGDDMYYGLWLGDMWTPDYSWTDGMPDTVYVASLENWEPATPPAQASLTWSGWHVWTCKVEAYLTLEEFNTLLPATADFVVRRYATEEDWQAGIVLWEDKLPLAFVAYSAD